jgi:hypothetical protein
MIRLGPGPLGHRGRHPRRLLGGFLAGAAGIAFGGSIGEVIGAFVGAVIVLLMVRMFSSRRTCSGIYDDKKFSYPERLVVEARYLGQG